MRGPVFNVNGPRPFIETEDGRTIYMDTPEGRAYARSVGVEMIDLGDMRPIGNTPPQDHHGNPHVVDPRPIRSLNELERKAIAVFVQRGAYLAVAGFENWRGRDRYYYVDVLGVGKDSDDAERHGMPVGPITASDAHGLRMVGSQLAMRVLDPWGYAINKDTDR